MTRTIPDVAVAMCTYNAERHISAQFDSILSQTRLPDFLVVADDGSEDETLTLCERFARRAPFEVRILPAQSPASPTRDYTRIARNFERALRVCAPASAVAFADQDDVWCTNRLSTQLQLLRTQTSPTFVFSDARLIDEVGESLTTTLWRHFPVPADWNDLRPREQLRFALRRPVVTGATMMVDSRFLDALLPIPPGWPHDRWATIVAPFVGTSLASRECLIAYRIHRRQQIGLARARRNAWRAPELVRSHGSLHAPLSKLRHVRERARKVGITDRSTVSELSLWRLIASREPGGQE